MSVCSACRKVLHTQGAFASHLWSKPGCVAGLDWPQWREWKAQEEEALRAKPDWCPIDTCPFRTASWQALEAHCWQCGKSAEEQDAALALLKPHSCHNCQRAFTTSDGLWSHEQGCGKTPADLLTAYDHDKPYKCGLCMRKSFPTQGAMESHMASCGKSADDLAAEVNAWYSLVCHCGKRFHDEEGKGGFNNHVLSCPREFQYQ